MSSSRASPTTTPGTSRGSSESSAGRPTCSTGTPNPSSELFYHGEDFRLELPGPADVFRHALFYASSIPRYDIFHFSNAHWMRFSDKLHECRRPSASRRAIRDQAAEASRQEDRLLEQRLPRRCAPVALRRRGGPSRPVRSARGACGPRCAATLENRSLGRVAEQSRRLPGQRERQPRRLTTTTHGSTRFPSSTASTRVWRPGLHVPPDYRLQSTGACHQALPLRRERHDAQSPPARARALSRRTSGSRSRPSFKAEGRDVELIYFTDVPNQAVRYYQAQADIVCDMLTIGWFGANVREAMMLGKPAVCFLRPEWIENVRRRGPGLRRGAAGGEREAGDGARRDRRAHRGSGAAS